jgi:hypothetical protein
LRPSPLKVDSRNIHAVGQHFCAHTILAAGASVPKSATAEQASYIRVRLADSSRPFGTKVEVKGDTAEINLKGGN